MSVELVKPQVIDGIEFYVSNDGKSTGVSISGVSRLCGVARQTIQGVMSAGKLPGKSLEGSDSLGFSTQLEGSDGAKIINSEAVVKIIDPFCGWLRYRCITCRKIGR